MAGLFKFLRKNAIDRKTHEQKAQRVTIVNPFHAGSIARAFDGSACNAAKACEGERFLSTEAPMLPLKGCDAAQCRCRYVHHDDRRAGPRRRADVWVGGTQMWSGSEQRRNRGRRVTDL